MANATSAAAVLGTIGINTHIDFGAYGYQNLANVESDISYLGVKIIRDSAQNPADAQTWLQVAQATGAKFDDYIGETSPTGMATDLGYVTQLAQEGILASIEGGNEEDDSYPASLGNTMQITAQFQQQVYALGQSLGLPVINMSFGAGWTAANNWQGDYGNVGDLSAYTNYANGHTYPLPGQLPDDTIQRMNGLAHLAASTRPVITTEIGWDDTIFDQQTIAKYVLDTVMDGVKDGDAGMYFYGLFDDGSGYWGLFNADGTPRPAATALHNLTSLLTDTGSNAASFTPTSLNYSLANTQTGDNSVLIEKSDGSFWLSLWNETEAANSPHTVTVNLGGQASSVIEYDPLTGTSSVQTWSNVSSVQVALPDHPILLEVITSGSSTTTNNGGGGTNTSTGGGSTTTTSSSGSSGSTSTPTSTPGTTLSSTDLTVNVPAAQNVALGGTQAISGVSISDAWSAATPGTMTVNVWDDAADGTVTLPGHSAAASLTISGTLAQINTELAGLSFTGTKAGTDGITVDAWNQAGVEKTVSFGLNIASVRPVITAPASENVTDGSTTGISGVSVSDAFAASSTGNVSLNLSATSGTLNVANAVGSAVTGLGTHSVAISGTLAQINADLANLSYTAPASSGSDAINVSVVDQAGQQQTQSIAVAVTLAPPAITAPAGASVSTGSTNYLAGTSVSDPFAAANTGSMVLNLSAGSGTINIVGAAGSSITGLGSHAVSVTGSLAQINADLANLTYVAGNGAGGDNIGVNVWDQAGLSSTSQIAVTVTAPPALQSVTIAPHTTSTVVSGIHKAVVTTAGNHTISLTGSGDTITALGGTESVMAFIGGNIITTGAGNDTIQIAGSGNVVNAAAGNNTIYDSGSNNTIILPPGGHGSDGIYGYVLQNSDIFDLRSMLSGSTWNGNVTTLGNYLHASTVNNGADAMFTFSPTGQTSGATSVLTLHGSGAVSVTTLLAHSLV